MAGSREPLSGGIRLFLHNFLPDVLSVLKSGEDDLAVAFFEARAPFGGEGVGAAGAADARFVRVRGQIFRRERPSTTKADFTGATLQSVHDGHAVIEYKTLAFP